jgi:hypothetical protein
MSFRIKRDTHRYIGCAVTLESEEKKDKTEKPLEDGKQNNDKLEDISDDISKTKQETVNSKKPKSSGGFAMKNEYIKNVDYY